MSECPGQCKRECERLYTDRCEAWARSCKPACTSACINDRLRDAQALKSDMFHGYGYLKDSPVERFYAHGVRAALGWALGIIDDPTLLAPTRTGDGNPIDPADRERYRQRLRELTADAQTLPR